MNGIVQWDVGTRTWTEVREGVRQDHFLTMVVMDECSHSPGGAVACAAARLACLPGSSGRWIPEAYGLI